MINKGTIGGDPINSHAINDEVKGMVFITNDICPISGNYKQIESGNIDWAEKGDQFPPYYKPTGKTDEEGRPLIDTEQKKAHYELVKE